MDNLALNLLVVLLCVGLLLLAGSAGDLSENRFRQPTAIQPGPGTCAAAFEYAMTGGSWVRAITSGACDSY